MWKRIRSALLALVMLLSLLPLPALAYEGDFYPVWEGFEEDMYVPEDDFLPYNDEFYDYYDYDGSAPMSGEEDAYIPDEDVLPDNDELFAGYVERLLYSDLIPDSMLFGIPAGERLTGDLNKALYGKLKTAIKEIAAGTRTSTVVTITASEHGQTLSSTINGSTTEDGQKAEAKKILDGAGYDSAAILKALLVDYPYDLYWFDKEAGMEGSYRISSEITSDGNGNVISTTIKITDFTFTFKVSQKYQDSNNTTVKGDDAARAKTAKENAEKVVSDYADKPDYDKLVAYKKYICDEVSYNKEAAEKDYSGGYGDPWQLIYVFDGNSATNVVCEGYSKAFKYLCDLSTFSDDVSCYIVTGTSNAGNGAGRHMWNHVEIGGKVYLVDVTNCDGDKNASEVSIGYPDKLFMVGSNMQVTIPDRQTTTYSFDTLSISYTVNHADNPWGTDVLTLSTKNYGDESDTPDDEKITLTPDMVTVDGRHFDNNGELSLFFDGAEHPVVVTCGDEVLSVNEDYTVTNNTIYENPKNVEKYIITITGQGKYTGEVIVTLHIRSRSITGADVKVSDSSQEGDKFTYTPTLKVTANVYLDGQPLPNTAYQTKITDSTGKTITGSDTLNAGAYNVTVTGLRGYTGTETTTFTVEKATPTVGTGAIKVLGDVYTNTTAVTLSGTAVLNDAAGKELQKVDGDFTVDGALPTFTAGQKATIKWKFTPKDKVNFEEVTGEIKVTVKINPSSVTSIVIDAKPTKVQYAYGDSVDLTGLQLYVKADGPEYVTYDANSGITCSPATFNTVGDSVTVTVRYAGKTDDFTVKVGRRPVTIKAKDQTIEYGERISETTDDVTAVGLVNGDQVVGVDLAADRTDIDTGTITPTGAKIGHGSTGMTHCYDITYDTGTLTITKPQLTAEGTGIAKGAYGDKLSELTVTGLTAKRKGAEVKGTWALTGDTVPNVGDGKEYTATFTPAAGAGNYETLTAKVKLDIKKARLTAVAEREEGVGLASGTYGDKLSDLKVTDLTAKLGDTEVEGTWALIGDEVPNAGGQERSWAIFTPKEGAGNYEPLRAEVRLCIGSATYEGTKTANSSAKFGSSGTCDLTLLLPPGVTGLRVDDDYVDINDTNAIFGEPRPALKGNVLSYTLVDNSTKVGQTGDVKVVVSAANYNEFDLIVTVTVSSKSVPVLTIDPISVTYSGKALTDSDIKGTAKVGNITLLGDWSFAPAGQGLTNVADSGRKTVKFTPKDTTNYDEVEGFVLVTIGNAKTTGAPKYTAVSAKGKTLADAKLTTEGGTFSTAGKVAWVLPVTTEVEEGKEYQWTFTPKDSANYDTLSGKITLWPRSSTNPGTNLGTNPGGTGSGSGSSGGGTYDPLPYYPIYPSAPSAPSSSNNSVSSSAVDQGGGYAMATTAYPSAAIRGVTATAAVNTALGNEIVSQAISNRSENVVVAPTVNGSVSRTEVSIPSSTVARIGSQTNANLTVSTPVADVTIPNSGLSSLSGAGGNVTVTADRVGNTVELSVTAGGRAVSEVPGGVTLTVPMTGATSGTVAMLVRQDGTREIVRKSVANAGGLTVPLDGSAQLIITDNSKYFSDVPATSWEADAVSFVSSHELFNGTGVNQFSPSQPMSRGMLAVVLHNLESNPAQAVTGAFGDVSSREWYAEGISWAAAKGIVSGYGNGRFGPNDSITREQLAVMLWRYAGSPTPSNGSLGFNDAYKASDWAQSALLWAVGRGVLNGKGGGILDPGGYATRAETAQMLKNFMESE